ncbi:shikimate O-hydroxycinnamoyltransferase-like [Dorcoceras hygrometricum]|uniref:Shikimate O-hydroxycinnamoyltransferase-like n=1 Tax=Dorcoceras hygrometricum TaxID=472368 RepID=A0A2Z7CJ60_9LAMI|nr:shikimate O-hydroxycinnamoyltransferase-like [Dorcoceras hygrometricum]
MEHEGMVAMFEALLLSRLSGFLGCSSTIYEAALVEFFHNASVRDGLNDLLEVPKDLVFEARSAFSYDGKHISTSYSIGYPRMSASGESSTTIHRLLHASGSHPISPPNDPNPELIFYSEPIRSCAALLRADPA